MAQGSSLHIVVPVKWVPDAQLERRITAEGDIERSEGVLGELDEYPLEAALRIKEALAEAPDPAEVSVSALVIGPKGASTAAKKALQIGADSAHHVSDEAIARADVLGTSLVLASAVQAVLADVDAEQYLLLTGMASEDGETSAVPAQLAERLGAHLVTQVTDLHYDGARVVATRASAVEQQKVAAPLPAVVSVTDQANEPRYPNFKAIMAAKKKPLTTWSLADINLDASSVQSRTVVVNAAARPPREAGEIITDEGDAGIQIVEFLAKERAL